MAAERPSSRFPTHHTASDLSPQSRLLCEIIAATQARDIEARLSSTKIQPQPETVQQVMKLSYNSPSAASKFFKWAGLARKHTAYSWNLMVDLLGKNKLFEPMWDAIRSMKQEVLERYGIQPDIVAVNSLLSAICREKKATLRALAFFDGIKSKITPDGDSFAILLEGFEKEGNVAKAKVTFGEMVIRVGWSPKYIFAYDAFLNTLVRDSHGDEAIKFLQVMKNKNCLPGLRFFSNALDIFVKQNNVAHGIMLWDVMIDSALVPTLIMYNTMIGLLCGNGVIANAFRLLDEMVFDGAFPDSLTYNMIFECLIMNKKGREIGKFFKEMVKNECAPTPVNFASGIAMLFECDDPEMAVEMWKYMVKNNISPLDDSANAVLLGFCDMERLSDLKIFAEKMIEEKIIIYETTMTKVRDSFLKQGRSGRDTYDHIALKWKSSYV